MIPIRKLDVIDERYLEMADGASVASLAADPRSSSNSTPETISVVLLYFIL